MFGYPEVPFMQKWEKNAIPTHFKFVCTIIIATDYLVLYQTENQPVGHYD